MFFSITDALVKVCFSFTSVTSELQIGSCSHNLLYYVDRLI